MRPLLVLAALSSFQLPGCFELPVLDRPDAPGDGRGPPAFTIVSAAVEGFDGRSFPGEIPRRPRFVVGFSARPDVATPVYLFSGIAADELAGDLGTSPLRASSEAGLVPAEITERFGALVLTPDAPLPAGAEVVLAVPAWATGAGVRLRTPFLATFVVSRDPTLGAAAVETWPPDRATGIGPEVPLFAVRFDGPVAIHEGSLSLHTADGRPVHAAARLGPCTEVGWSGPDCAMLEPPVALAPRTEHVLRVDGATDGTGAPLAPLEIRVTTGDEARDPVLGALECAPDEADDVDGVCVLADDRSVAVRVIGSEPLRLTLDTLGGRVRTVLPRGAGTLALSGLAASALLPATLVVTNASGRTLELPLELRTTDPLPAIAIVEVRADPLGREPAQEYVELENRGEEPVELSEMRISDALLDDGDPLPPMLVPPGARVLVVATGFDPDSDVDGIVPPGVALVRVDASIASSGLSSFGEPLFLRAAGHRLSAVPPRPTEPGACLVRVVDDPRRGDDAAFVEGPCTPGTAP